MKIIRIICCICCVQTAFAQQIEKDNKWFFGVAAGVSSVHLTGGGLGNENQVSLSFPNMKAGIMLNRKTALALLLPGSIYQYNGPGRVRDRGFEGMILSGQYWIVPKWWVLAGAGITMDAPAFYDIKGAEERKFYFGPGVLCATGVELYRKNRFVLDVQTRVHYGYTSNPQGHRTGVAANLLLGMNWYFHGHA